MFIETEQTPNPATPQIPARPRRDDGRHGELPRRRELRPLAAGASACSRVEGVTGVFLGADFVSVSKDEAIDWYPPQARRARRRSWSISPPASPPSWARSRPTTTEDDDEIVSQIKELLETRVRPAVAQDGGDIIFHRFEDGVVYLHMQGSCSGCPSSTATLKAGIENMLRHYVPEVTEVRAI